MSLPLVEEKKNASSTNSQNTLFVPDSRESEIEIEERGNQSTEKKFTPTESKNEDGEQNDEEDTHYDRQTSNVIAKAVISKKVIKRKENPEKSIDPSIASKTTIRKSRKILNREVESVCID